MLRSQDCHLNYLTVGNSFGDRVKIIGSRIVQLLYRRLSRWGECMVGEMVSGQVTPHNPRGCWCVHWNLLNH